MVIGGITITSRSTEDIRLAKRLLAEVKNEAAVLERSAVQVGKKKMFTVHWEMHRRSNQP
jgi:hypothetical protein